MKTIQIDAHIIARKWSWESEPTFFLSNWDHDGMSDQVAVGKTTVTVEVPETVDFTAKNVAVLKAEKAELTERFKARIDEINEQLSKYQALEYSA